jgi:hypothetical protein
MPDYLIASHNFFLIKSGGVTRRFYAVVMQKCSGPPCAA